MQNQHEGNEEPPPQPRTDLLVDRGTACALEGCIKGERSYNPRAQAAGVHREQEISQKTHQADKCFLELCDATDQDSWGSAYKVVVKKMSQAKTLGTGEANQIKAIVQYLFPTERSAPQREQVAPAPESSQGYALRKGSRPGRHPGHCSKTCYARAPRSSQYA